jgi:predicted transport protein
VCCSTEIKAECEKLVFLKNVSDPSIIINQLHPLVILVNDWSIKKHSLEPCLSKYDVEHLKDVYEIIQADLDKLGDTNESNIQELKIQLKKLFENFKDILYAQSEHILVLGQRLTKLEEEKKKIEKYKIIGDLLIPLSKVDNKSKIKILSTI